MEQVEATSARQGGPEFCHICDQRHSCGQSTPSVVQSFEVDLDGSQSRSCYKKFLIICILALLVLILAVIILRSIF